MLNAQITHFLHINFPEYLSEEEWWFKAEQYIALNDAEFLPVKIKFNNNLNSSKTKEDANAD